MTETFSNTRVALSQIQNLLRCCDCNYVAESPCTLGGCEHIFCSKCCENRLGENCPVCSIPGHAKDAQVNRQLFNLAKLCHRLERILTNPQTVDRNNETSKKSAVKATKVPCYMATDETGNTNSEVKVKDPCTIFDLSSSSTGSSPVRPRSSSKKRAQKTVTIKKKRTIDEKITSDFDKTYTPNAKQQPKKEKTSSEKKQGTKSNQKASVPTELHTAKLGLRKDVPEDQTTMTQFFDCVDDEDLFAADDGEGCTLIKDKVETRSESVKQKQTPKSKQNSSNIEIPSNYKKSEVAETPQDKIKQSGIMVKKGRKSGEFKKNLRTRHKQDENITFQTDTSPEQTTSCKVTQSGKRRHSVGVVSNLGAKVTQTTKRSRRSISPVTGQGGDIHRTGQKTPGSGSAKKNTIDKRNAKGETALQVACIKGDTTKVKSLLESGASPNTRDNAGWSPLHEACHHGHLKIAELLLDYGALINVPGTENETPLHDAMSHNRIECVRLLVSRGASLTARNIHGRTPVEYAVTEEMKAALNTKVMTSSEEESETMDALDYQEPCFLATALSRDQKITLQKCASILQAKIADHFIPEVTHVITSTNKEGMCPRTIKYLLGVLQGKWIVSMEWIDLCLEYGIKVCEEAFEIPGTSTDPNVMSAAKGRINRKKQLPGLFDGCQFYFHGNFEYPTPEKEQLKALVKAGGGQVLTREPKDNMDETLPMVPYHAPSSGKLRNCCVFIVHDKCDTAIDVRSPSRCSVPASWIMDCIAAFRILEPLQN